MTFLALYKTVRGKYDIKWCSWFSYLSTVNSHLWTQTLISARETHISTDTSKLISVVCFWKQKLIIQPNFTQYNGERIRGRWVFYVINRKENQNEDLYSIISTVLINTSGVANQWLLLLFWVCIFLAAGRRAVLMYNKGNVLNKLYVKFFQETTAI